MWLNPLKGAHLTLGQLDKTLPVSIERTSPTVANPNEAIERGSIVYIKAYNGKAAVEPQFAIYTEAEAVKPNAVPYIALMGVKDYQAGMAGNVGQAPEAQGIAKGTKAAGANASFLNPTNVEGAQTFLGPRITAISLVQPAEWETTAFDDGGTEFYVGEMLTVANGKLTHWETGKNLVGYVTAKNYVRWINDLGSTADGARISGGNATVIAFSTAWIPAAATSGDSGNVKPLATDSKKVAVEAPKAAPAAQTPIATEAPKAQPAQGAQAAKPVNVAK